MGKLNKMDWNNVEEERQKGRRRIREKTEKVAIPFKIVDLKTILYGKKLTLSENSNRILMEIIHLGKLVRTMYNVHV